jgi:hypothetical protein
MHQANGMKNIKVADNAKVLKLDSNLFSHSKSHLF